MGACSSRKVADLMVQSQVHPLVEKLSDGLAIYSQSFLNDFWCSFVFLRGAHLSSFSYAHLSSCVSGAQLSSCVHNQTLYYAS